MMRFWSCCHSKALLAAFISIGGSTSSAQYDEAAPSCEAASLLQHSTMRHRALNLALSTGQNGTCAELTNHGTHFTVDIEVGTPGQKFSVVADTGSNALIVPSCVCQRRHYCQTSDRCFTGTNRSSSFHMESGRDGHKSVFMTFGSGTIEAVYAREMVRVGHLSVDMKGGILLMVARNLNIAGKFEGILGLGLPNKPDHKRRGKQASETSQATDRKSKDMMKQIVDSIFGDDEEFDADAIVAKTAPGANSGSWKAQPTETPHTVQEHGADNMGHALQIGTPYGVNFAPGPFQPVRLSRQADGTGFGWRQSQDVTPKSLLEQAGISRFSMCFNDGASGVLKLGIPESEMADSLGSVGEYHWGLDFRGVSIGNSTVPLSFCSGSNMTNGQETPCGAIPDSGTTVIMAPKEHLASLMDSICDNWPRCAKNYSAMAKAAEKARQGATEEYSWDPFEIAPAEKFQVLQLLLLDCGSWLNESGLAELPSLKFHVAGAGGKSQELELPGWAYILESTHDDVDKNYQLQGLDINFAFFQNHVRKTKVCSPAFGAMEYKTKKNGPVWILGTPFFYEFKVGYEMNSVPPSISFTSTDNSPCVSCGGEAALLASEGQAKRRPRWISGPVRVPEFNLELPL